MPGYEVKFETFTIGDFDYQVRSLLDKQQYCDRDGEAERAGIPAAMWPIFGLVWPAGLYLAETMTKFQIHGRRILEIGCGIGLASLVLQRRCADITSTDLHPLAESFLAENLLLNQMTAFPFHRCSWSQTLPELGRFDLIIGSDLLYEPEHPQLLAGFIDRHATANVEVIIVDPGRGNHGKFNRAMVKLGFHQNKEWSDLQPIRTVMKKGHLLNYRRAP